LFQGIRDIPGTDTCFFVELKSIPNDRKITYGKIVCGCKPHKQQKERVRLTIGGDRLDYLGDVATSTADITTFKIIINSTLSTEDAAMMMVDIKNYYLSVKLPQPQLRTRTYTQTGQSTLRATQVRAALSHAYAVTYQKRIMDKP
jgi:hypothetical protein